MFTNAHLTATEPVLAAVCVDFGAALVEFNGGPETAVLSTTPPVERQAAVSDRCILAPTRT